MKITRIVLFILFTLFFCNTKVHAQVNLFDANNLSNINIDDYSDADLTSLLNKAQESGISESQLYKLAAEKGMPDAEITKLRNRLQFLSPPKKSTEKINHENPIDTGDFHRYDSTAQYVPTQKFKNDKTIFGSELFTSNSLVFEPNLRIPAPAGYILGPDDEIVVSVYGLVKRNTI